MKMVKAFICNYYHVKAPFLIFNWVLNTFLILSSNVIWHAYGLISDSRFSGFVYHPCLLRPKHKGRIDEKLYYKNIIYIASNAKN